MRPIRYRPVLTYRVPEAGRFVERDQARARQKERPARRMAPVVVRLSEDLAQVHARLKDLSASSGVPRETLSAFYLAEPSSAEGRSARSAVHEEAGGFMGDQGTRRALVLEAARISIEQSLASGLRAWGSENPDTDAASSLDQAAFDRLASDEEALRITDGDEAKGRLRRIDAWALRLERRSSWVRGLMEREGGLTVPEAIRVVLSSGPVRDRIQLVLGQRMRSVDQAYWEAISRARQSIGAFPRLVGARAVQERATYEWADGLVLAAEEWVRSDPRAEPLAAELVAELARMRVLYETAWSVAMEAEEGLERACDQALELMDPFLRIQAIFRSFGAG